MRKYTYSTISFVVFAIPVIFLISELFAVREHIGSVIIGLSSTGGFLVNFIAYYLFCTECMIYDIDYIAVAESIINLITILNINLLILSYIYTIILLLISDITKISIHWLIKSVILAGLIILINYYFLNSSLYMAADFISASGAMLLNLFTLIYYLLLLNLILSTNKLFR